MFLFLFLLIVIVFCKNNIKFLTLCELIEIRISQLGWRDLLRTLGPNTNQSFLVINPMKQKARGVFFQQFLVIFRN